MDYQKLLVEHLELIDRVVRYVARRHHLTVADAEEFGSVVRFRLIDRDYAVLRKFQGRSNLGTYLTTVVERLYLDFCISRWGKWRPSAAAKRLGPVAILLEQLIARDGLTFDEAVSTVQTNHNIAITRDELRALCVQLPTRTTRRLATEEEFAVAVNRLATSDSSLADDEDREIVARVEAALATHVAALAPRQQLILKLRYQDGMTIADIARLLHLPGKPLYREISEIIDGLRGKLRQEGIDKTDIDRIVGHSALTLGRVFETVGEADGGSV